jgi:hypothetical protein
MNEDLRGNLHAIEFLLTQLFAMGLKDVEDPQAWISQNLSQVGEKISRSEGLNEREQDAAQGTVRRVMQMTSWHFDANGRGPAIDS